MKQYFVTEKNSNPERGDYFTAKSANEAKKLAAKAYNYDIRDLKARAVKASHV